MPQKETSDILSAGLKFAAAYTRVSTDEQVEFSLDAQVKALKDYAGKNGYTILPEHIFTDDGYSGRRAEKRPAFMRMIATAKQQPKPFEAILVHKIDRFARSREDSVVYKSLLRKECGVKVISITESIEDDKFSIILEAMLEAMAEYYSINLSEEVKKGMTEKALRGGLQSIAAFGYEVENNILVPLEKEAALIREIFSRFIAGDGYYVIARWLNELGVTTHRGGRFENRTIEYIIRNPAYIGKLRWNPTGKTRRDYDNKNIILAEGQHEPLIDMQTWEAAQQRVIEIKTQWKYHGRPITEYRDWISGLVRCASCGCTLVFVKPHYWRCNGYSKGACRHSQHVRDNDLKNALIERLSLDIKDIANVKYKTIRQTESGIDEESALETQKNRLKRNVERLREAFVSGVESVEEYGVAKKLIENEIEEIDKRISLLQADNKKEDVEKNVQKAIMDTVTILTSANASVAEKHKAAISIIDSCTFDKAQNLLSVQYQYIF